VRFHVLLECVRIHHAEIGRTVSEDYDPVDAPRQIMTQRGLVGRVHCVFKIRAALWREIADFFRRFDGLVTRDAVHPQSRRARERDDAELVLGLELAGQHAQRLANDAHPVRALHRSGIVQQQHQVQRPARLTTGGSRLDRETQQIAVLGIRISRPLQAKATGTPIGGSGSRNRTR